MLPKLVYALLCSDVIVDRESGSASFIRAFEHGTVPKFPATVPPCYIATLWETDPGSGEPFTIGLALVTPEGENKPLGTNLVTPTGAALHKVNFRLPGINVDKEGRHGLVISVQQGKQTEISKTLPLYVFQQAQTDQPSA